MGPRQGADVTCASHGAADVTWASHGGGGCHMGLPRGAGVTWASHGGVILSMIHARKNGMMY